MAFVLVLFPQTYRTGRDEPAFWREAFLQARRCIKAFLEMESDANTAELLRNN